MKNMWIINHYAIPPDFGGLNRHYYFSKYLKNFGYNTKIFTSSKIHNSKVNLINNKKEKVKELDFDGVEYTFLKTSDYFNNNFSRIKNMLEFPCRVLINYKKFEKPDLIYTSSPSLFTACAAMILAKKIKVPIIVEVRDLWPEAMVAYNKISSKNIIVKYFYSMEKWLYKNADKLIFTMEGAREYIKEKKLENLVSLEKIYNINNGVDLEEFESNLKKFVLKDPDLEDKNSFKIVYVGSIREVNHLEDLVNTAKIIQEKYNNIKFIVYGDGTEKEILEKKCNSENINNIVFKGHVSRKYIPYILSKSNLNIIINNQTKLMRFGSSFNKMFDYMASGKPIVSNLSSNYDLLERYKCGIAARSSKPEDLVRSIEIIYNISEKFYKKLCENSKKAAKHFDYKFLTEKLYDIIKDI